MKIKIILLMCISLLSCTNPRKNRTTKTGKDLQIEIFGDKVSRLPINNSIKLDKSKITLWLIDNYFYGRQIGVDLVKDSEGTRIFKVEIKGELATNVPKYYTFICLSNKYCYLLPIEFNQFININNKIMFGGVYNYREFDYYFIYDIDGKDLKLTFDSRKVNRDGLKIGYYRDDDCFEYYPNRLVFNNDLKTSIFFNGVVKKFCKEEQDRTTQQNQPLTEEKVSIRIDYNGKSWVYNKNSKYRFW